MKITLIGASGFIGRHLSAALRNRGDTVAAVSLRDITTAARECEGADAVVNLAGENIAVRWTAEVKEKIRSSRVDLPRRLIETFGTSNQPPKAYISASAVGYYGTDTNKVFTESSVPGNDFLAEVCVAWEAQAQKAADHGCRVAVVRTGLTLAKDGGAMARILPIFRLGGGGVIASGNQWYSWIHIDDLIGIYLMVIDAGQGAFNATAPNPVHNREFTRAIASVLRRRAFIPVPEFIIETMLGEGSVLLTKGQCVLPERTMEQGYHFHYRLIDQACAGVILRSTT